MSYRSNPPHHSQEAENETKSNPIPIPTLHFNPLSIDISRLTLNYCSPSSASDSAFPSSYPSSPAISSNQAGSPAPFMGSQTPSLSFESLNSFSPIDTFSMHPSHIIDGHFDFSCVRPLDGWFSPQIPSPLMINPPLGQVPYAGLVEDFQPPGGGHPPQALPPMSFSPTISENLTPPGHICFHPWNGGTASGVDGFVPGTPSDWFNMPEIPSLHQGTTQQGTTDASTSGSNSDPQPTLPSSASGLTPAELAYRFQHSSYVKENRLEPTDYRRRSVFLQLLRETPNPQHHYKCIIPLPDGTPCPKSFNRPDRGVTHIRAHFDHRPFSCDDRCGSKKCSHRFHSNEGLAAHLNPKFERCKKCRTKFRRQNVRRHEERCPGLQ